MSHQVFSKIWIIVILVALIGGGIFIYQNQLIKENFAFANFSATFQLLAEDINQQKIEKIIEYEDQIEVIYKDKKSYLYLAKEPDISLSQSLLSQGVDPTHFSNLEIIHKQKSFKEENRLSIFLGNSLMFALPFIYLFAIYCSILLGLRIFQIEKISRFKIIVFMFVAPLIAYFINLIAIKILGLNIVFDKFIYYPISLSIFFTVTLLFLKYYFKLFGKKLWQFSIYLFIVFSIFSLIIELFL